MKSWKKTFLTIWTGQALSILSSYAVGFAIVLWLSFKTQSAEVLAYATIAALLPQAVLGTFAGVYIDRWNRKTTMILADSFIAFCTLILSVLFYFDIMETWHIYALLAFRSAGAAFHSPAMKASVPLLAPKSELMRIAGINQTIESASNIAGPALGALLFSIMDFSWILLLDVFGAIAACTALAFVTIPKPPRNESKEKPHLVRETKEAIREVRNHKGMPLLFLFSIIITFCIMPVSALFPLMTLNHFSGNEFQMSIVEIAWGVGALAGGGLLGIWKVRMNKVILINLTYIAIGISFLFSGLLSPAMFAMFVALTALGGISGSIYNASFTAILQERVNPAVLGRVFSLFMSASLLPSMIGLLATGFLADSIGLANTFIVSGGLIIIVSVIALYSRSTFPLGANSGIAKEQT